jgi:hypothetical protein
VIGQAHRRSRAPLAQRDLARPQLTFASAPQLPPSANCQLLRGGKYTGDFDYDDILKLVQDARGQERFGYRGVFLTPVNLAKSLDGGNKQAAR